MLNLNALKTYYPINWLETKKKSDALENIPLLQRSVRSVNKSKNIDCN